MMQQPFLFGGATLPEEFHAAWSGVERERQHVAVVKILTAEMRAGRWTIHMRVDGVRVAVVHREDLAQAARDLFNYAHPVQ